MTGPSLDERLTALEEAAGLAGTRVTLPQLSEAAAVCERTRGRLGYGTHHAVVAIAGPTGGGKSTLFNALAGGELAPAGLRRPTTATATAAVWGSDVEPLLRWLEITRSRPAPRQDTAPGSDHPLDGLVLIDLPDHDSVERSHQLEMERLTDRADLLLWVTDPQKYGDASLHTYLRNLAGQDTTLLVVLNQIDLLTPTELETCRSELTGILHDDGLDHVTVLPISAAAGTGLPQLEQRLADVVGTRRAAVDRAVLAVSAAAQDLDRALDLGDPGSGGTGDRRRLSSELSAAAGADAACDAMASSHRRMATLRTGWPVTRWISAIRRDPLKPLRTADRPAVPSLRPTGIATPSASEPSGPPVDEARIRAAVRTYVEEAVGSDAPTWQAVGRRAAARHGDALGGIARATVVEAALEPTPLPRWWRFGAFGQRLAGIAALVGLAWLVAIAALEWVKVPEVPLPRIGDVPVPTALFLGGVLAGLLIAWISRLAAGVGADRRAARARSRIDAAVGRVADELVVAPLGAELADLRRIDELLGVAGT